MVAGFLSSLQFTGPNKYKSLNRRICGMPKLVCLIYEPVSLFYRWSKIKIRPFCIRIDTLCYDGNVRLSVSKFRQIKSDLSSVYADYDDIFGPTVDVPLTVFGRQFNSCHRSGRWRRGRYDRDRGYGGKRCLHRDCLKLCGSLWRRSGPAVGKPDNQEQKNQENYEKSSRSLWRTTTFC